MRISNSRLACDRSPDSRAITRWDHWLAQARLQSVKGSRDGEVHPRTAPCLDSSLGGSVLLRRPCETVGQHSAGVDSEVSGRLFLDEFAQPAESVVPLS
jgi:hypothetical protein